MINGTEYAFEDVKSSMVNRSLVGFEALSYGASKQHKNIFGKGNRPVAMSRGKKDASPAKIVIHQSEFEAMQRSAPAGSDPTDWAPFEWVVSYAPEGDVITTDIIPYCRVTSWEKGMRTDDGHMTIELNMVTGIPLLNQ